MIIICLDQPSLMHLAKTCRLYFLRALPHLYQDIDLSTHNRPPIEDPNFSDGRLMFADQQPLQPVPSWMIERQHSFITSLINYPERGQYVESFSWTLLFAIEVGRPSAEDIPPAIPIAPSETSTWDVFQTLTQVKFLDFASLSTYHYPYTTQHPQTLFPSATSIRLLGVMPRSLPKSILNSINPFNLTHLALDDLQDWGSTENGQPMTANESSMLGTDDVEAQNPYSRQIIVFPGPMYGILDNHIARGLTALRSLHLRKAGHRDSLYDAFSATDDTAVYREWAAFLQLDDIQATLEELVLEQGIVQRALRGSCRRGSFTRPMDRRFIDIVLPVLLTARWKCLRRFDLQGVGLDLSYGTEKELRLRLGPGVHYTRRLTIAKKPCTRFCGFAPP